MSKSTMQAVRRRVGVIVTTKLKRVKNGVYLRNIRLKDVEFEGLPNMTKFNLARVDADNQMVRLIYIFVDADHCAA